MAKTRTNQEANSVEEILSILNQGDYPEMAWVGRNYSKADLIRDLNKLKEGAADGS